MIDRPANSTYQDIVKYLLLPNIAKKLLLSPGQLRGLSFHLICILIHALATFQCIQDGPLLLHQMA